MNRFLVVLALASASVIGCSTPSGTSDAAPASDAFRADTALVDSGLVDSGSIDSGSIDSGLVPPLDAGSDAGTVAQDVGADGGPATTTIRIVYPAGHTITLRGSASPLDWTTGIAVPEIGGGVYEIAIEGLAAPAEIKPLLDDATWSRGPNYHVTPGARIEIAPHFAATSGRVTTLIPSWSSAILGNTRAVYAYLPAAYDENTEARFPLVTMHDGQNLFDAALAFSHVEWQVDETMDAAGERGLCEDGSSCGSDGDCSAGPCETYEAVVVGVANTAARNDEYTPTVDATYGGGHADDYLRALIEELTPQLDAMLRTRTGREDRAIVGSSLGGLASAHAGIVHGETWGLVGAMSPSTWWADGALLGEVATIPSHTPRALRVYVDSGDSGASMDDVTDTAMLAAGYRAVGYVEGVDLHYVLEPGGQHNEVYWAERLPMALRFLLPRRERALP